MTSDDAEIGAKLRRFQELEKGRSRRTQSCANLVSALNETAANLRSAIDRAGTLTDVSLPKFPDKTTIVTTFNDMLELEMEYHKLAGELNLPPRGRPDFTFRG